MMPFKNCPICGGDLQEKEVEKLIRGGKNTAAVKVTAEVCTKCGERLYSQDTVKSFEQIKSKLEQEKTKEFRPLGRSFQVSL
ncbi:MAG: YgiT-type zinc finger protein [Bacteroidetes bacterium]|nr:YgiT-type zinc finger protein [Bacteroidota bacterium]MBU2584426.1 YgiT-type zinc finger protein [Bacteroidota bacterium]